jgi:23S rRNA (uridine2552-2'-O)-methyltransferase
MTRAKASKAWMREHVNDPYVKRAQADGYRSRAAYKLREIAVRDKLFKPGMTVVDLGAAPGGWSKVAAQLVKPGGQVFAVDLLEIEPLSGVTCIQGNFSDESTRVELERILAGREVDLVISDMAPNLSGIASTDQARALGLAELALEFAVIRVKPEGCFLVKLFQGTGFDDFVRALRRHFEQVLVRKPDASRSRSSEVYLLARRLKQR